MIYAFVYLINRNKLTFSQPDIKRKPKFQKIYEKMDINLIQISQGSKCTNILARQRTDNALITDQPVRLHI